MLVKLTDAEDGKTMYVNPANIVVVFNKDTKTILGMRDGVSVGVKESLDDVVSAIGVMQ